MRDFCHCNLIIVCLGVKWLVFKGEFFLYSLVDSLELLAGYQVTFDSHS